MRLNVIYFRKKNSINLESYIQVMKFLIQFELKYPSYITAKNYHLNIKCVFFFKFNA